MPEVKSEVGKILAGRERVAIVRNGEVVGYRYPPAGDPIARRLAIRAAGANFDKMVERLGLTEAELTAAYESIRAADRKTRRNGS